MKPPRLFVLLSVLACASSAVPAQTRGEGYGLELRETASVQDLEMPVYPQAVKQPGSNGDKGAVSMGLWSPNWGFRLAVQKFRSGDSVAQVAQFYRAELARYGTVLECPLAEVSPKPAPAPEGVLVCGDDKPKRGGVVLKVGVKKDFRSIAIEPGDGGALFDLVRLKTAGL